MQASTGKNLFSGLLIGSGLYLLYNWISKGKAAGSLNFIQGSVKGIYFDGITPYITVGIVVQNTSSEIFTISSIAADVTAQSLGKVYSIGNVSTFTQQQILPNSQSTLWVDIRLSLIGVVKDLLNTYYYGFQQTINFNGFANVENLQIPINFDYTI